MHSIGFFLLIGALLTSPIYASSMLDTATKLSPDDGVIALINPVDAMEEGSITIQRGKVHLYGKPILKPGDVVHIKGLASLKVRMADGNSVIIDKKVAGERGYLFHPEKVSLFDNLAHKYGFGSAASMVVVAGTRGNKCGQGELAMPANMPDAIPFYLQSGERELHFRWVGGKPPYRLTLSRNGKVLAEGQVDNACEITFHKQIWQPGIYTLDLRDGPCLALEQQKDCAWFDERVTVVEPGKLPPMPQEIAKSSLDIVEKQALYAEYLAQEDQGNWRLEALQQLFPWKASNRYALDWLRNWGGGAP